MDEKTRAHFATLIDVHISKIQEELADLFMWTTPIAPDCSLGRLTRMEAISEQEVAKEKVRQNETRLEKLRFALARVQHPTYGDCMECEEPIALARLELLPETTLCIACAHERN